MAIRNVQILSNASSYGAYNQKLTQATRQKLEMLGLSYNSNITEQEGLKLIQKYEALQSNKADDKKENLFSSQNKNKDDNLEQLKRLAAQLGINSEKNADFDKLVRLVEATLEEKIKASSNDINQLNYLKSLSQDLAHIQSNNGAAPAYNNSNQALMMSLEMLSQYNKNFLNR